ncbi:MAG: lipid-A-disaccharide synthase [Chthoniobacterales bacterium]
MGPKRLYFVAGEASGDAHGAALIAALRRLHPDVVITGRGGPRMRAATEGSVVDWSRHSAVLGLWEVLKKYRYFRRQFTNSLRAISEQEVDAVILIDYPGFNLRLARALSKKQPDLKIIYYISPQVWAWNRGRIPKMAECLDLMLCIFPFEADIYNQSGLRTVFVGHPMIEALGAGPKETRVPNLFGLFPGSRWREVRKILPVMVRAAELIHDAMPDVRFEVASASVSFNREIERQLRHSRLPADATEITTGQAEAAMQRASAALIASGTATLQGAFFRLPFVLVYRVPWFFYLPARALVRVKYLGMPNVLAGREIVPEFIQHRAQPRAIAQDALRLLQDKEARDRQLAEFDRIIATLGQDGASSTAAQAIMDELGDGAAR